MNKVFILNKKMMFVGDDFYMGNELYLKETTQALTPFLAIEEATRCLLDRKSVV